MFAEAIHNLIVEFEKSNDSHQKELARRARRAYDDLQEIATSMHLELVYLIFDIEVTKREFEYIQSLLENELNFDGME